MMGEETGSVVDSSCEVSISDVVFDVDDMGALGFVLWTGDESCKLMMQVKKKNLNL